MVEPIYNASNTEPAYQLNWGLTSKSRSLNRGASYLAHFDIEPLEVHCLSEPRG